MQPALDVAGINFRVSPLTNCIEGGYGRKPSILNSEGKSVLREADRVVLRGVWTAYCSKPEEENIVCHGKAARVSGVFPLSAAVETRRLILRLTKELSCQGYRQMGR